MCLGKEEGQCVLEWCASCNFDTTRTALVREMCDCIDDLKYADDEDVDEMIVEWKPPAQSFKKKLALLKSGFSGEGAAALNQPGAFASGFSAAAAAAPPSPRQGAPRRGAVVAAGGRAEAAPSRPARARAGAPATQAPSDAEASSDDAASEDEAARSGARRGGEEEGAEEGPGRAEGEAGAGEEAGHGRPAAGDAGLLRGGALGAPKPQLGDLGGVVLAERGDGRCAKPAPPAVLEFLDLGGRRDDLKHDLAKGFVVVVGPGHGRSRVSSDVADDTDDDDGVIDLGPPAEDKALDAEVAGLLAGGDGDDDALLTISL
ncbi:hypothetical protein JL720_4765 [Aureococcus anophagefferens]|nr:hypothetical protein JL720_4765 [Aureococcus anophagefferens]